MRSLLQKIRSWFDAIRSRFAPAQKKVGLLFAVSTHDVGKLLTAFKGSLGTDVVVIPRYANGNYGQLVTLAKQLMQSPDKVDVIAAGSYTALQAAVQAASEMPSIKIPIVFIGDKTSAHTSVSGGINLQMPSFHGQRVAELRSPRYHARIVGLLVNVKAAVGSEEEKNWDPNWGPVQPVQANNEADLRTAVDNLATRTDAIVVASDPYFTSKRNQLVEQLNTKNKPVCYPFESYKTDLRPGLSPRNGKSMRFGVDLLKQYKDFGGKAKRALDALAANPGQIPQVGIDNVTSTATHW
jgi:hypothetical protein